MRETWKPPEIENGKEIVNHQTLRHLTNVCQNYGKNHGIYSCPRFLRSTLFFNSGLVWEENRWYQLATFHRVLSLPGHPDPNLLLENLQLNVGDICKIRQENHEACLPIKRVVFDVKDAVERGRVITHLFWDNI